MSPPRPLLPRPQPPGSAQDSPEPPTPRTPCPAPGVPAPCRSEGCLRGKGTAPGHPHRALTPLNSMLKQRAARAEVLGAGPAPSPCRTPPKAWAWCQAGGTHHLPGAPGTRGQRAWGASAKGGFIPARAAPGCWRPPTRRDYFFFFLRRSLLTPSLSSFSRGTARGVGKKQNRCERWSPALAERRGLGSSSTAVLSGMGGTWQGWDLSWQGPAVTCAGCWVLGTMLHPGQPGWGSHGCPGCGAQLWRPPRGVTSFVPVLREELVLQKHRDL